MTLGALLWLTRGGAPPREPAPAPQRTAAVRESIPSAPAPATTLPAPSAAADPTAARRAEIRARLESDLAEHLPDRKLSSDQLDAATDALLRLRAARLELRALPRTPENASRRRELRAALGEAAVDFEYVVGLDPAEFTEQVSPGDEG